MENNYINDIIPNNNNDLKYEREFWLRFLFKQLIFLPVICINCGNNRINLTEYNTLANPFVGRCTYNKCSKLYYLREKTFFGLVPKTPASTVFYILKLWILEKKMLMKYLLNLIQIIPKYLLVKRKFWRFYIKQEFI